MLLYDLETSPNLGYSWGTRETDIIKVVRPRQIMLASWKWLGEKEIYAKGLIDYPGYKQDPHNNRALVTELHRVISEADICVAHNLKRFDDRRSNTDFIKHGLTPPPPHKQVCTLEFARHKFDFNSNRLGDLGEFLGLGGKVKHPGFEMWEAAMNGEKWAWDLFKKYARGDVRLLEGVYLKERPWMLRHPSMIPVDRAHFACPKCQSPTLNARGWSTTRAGKKQRYQCNACGSWATGTIVKRELRLA